MKILSRYILREHIAPFFLSLLVVTFVLLIDRVIDLLDLIIEKKLDANTVLQLFGLSLPYMIALSIPMAVLVATILAFGRMTVDRETIAMKSSGINLYRMLGPLIVTTLLLTGVMAWFNHYFLPNANHKLKNLTVKIAYYRPMTIIKPNEFTTLTNYTIYVRENLNNELRDVLIYDRSQTKLPGLSLLKPVKWCSLTMATAFRSSSTAAKCTNATNRSRANTSCGVSRTFPCTSEIWPPIWISRTAPTAATGR